MYYKNYGKVKKLVDSYDKNMLQQQLDLLKANKYVVDNKTFKKFE